MSTSIEYTSFLIRLWRQVSDRTSDPPRGWQGEVEHIQTGEHWTFESLEELLEFLRRETTSPSERPIVTHSGGFSGT